MPYELSDKLVVAVASSAVFDLTESDRVFREQGTEAYREHQRSREDEPLAPGVAFPFVRRLLSLNDDPDHRLVEVVLLSRNDPDTGARVLRSAEGHGLDIGRAAFTSGNAPWRYIEAFGASLFLSANPEDVQEAVRRGLPAGRVIPGGGVRDDDDPGLRVAFDFDGVLADDASERVFREGGLGAFERNEKENAGAALAGGPLRPLLAKLGAIRAWERERASRDPGFRPRLRTAIATARGTATHQRVVTTLRSWGLSVDETFFLGGVEKSRVLSTFAPHIFFDDQLSHAEPAGQILPAVHIPFGIANPL